MTSLTWLHLSDWHQKGADFDRTVVRDALVRDIEDRRAIDPRLAEVDFVVFSGDLANGGKEAEYKAAREQLLDPVLKAVGVAPARLIVVPGNHDLDRDELKFVPAGLTKPLGSSQEVHEWLTKDKPRALAFDPFSQFKTFVAEYTGQKSPDYANLVRFEIRGRSVAILGLNSAWMCGRNKNAKGEVDDDRHLVVGEPQIHAALEAMRGDDVRIAVLHHPWEWLTDWDRELVQERVQRASHFVLMGHVHRAKVNVSMGTGGDCVEVPAGASYDRRTASNLRYTNAYNLIHVDFATAHGTAFLRRWSEEQCAWIAATDTFRDGRYEFPLPGGLRAAKAAVASPSEPPKSAPRTPHNLTARNLDFRGRREEIAALDETLRHQTRATITHASVFGLGGIGKSALALEYAHRAVERGEYPGGVWWVHAEGKPVDALMKLAPTLRVHATPDVQKLLVGEETLPEQIVEAVRLALQAQRARSLLVLDNVSERGWAPYLPAGEVRVLLTTRDEKLAQGSRRRLEVLPPAQAREVADAIAGAPRDDAEAKAQERVLVTELGGLAVAVEMAARGVSTQLHSRIAYERVLRAEMDRVLEDPDLVSEYRRGVFAAIDLSIDRCGSDARALLEGAAIFAPDLVPLAWALEAAGLASEGAAAAAMATVKALGLVTLDEEAGAMSLHRLVHRQVRSRAQRAEREDVWREVSRRGAEAAAEWMDGAVEVNRTRAEMEAVDARREHLDQALEAADRVGSQGAWIRIADRQATHLRNRARNDDARALFQEALARAEQLDPPAPSRVATSLSHLALVLQALGDAAGARPLLERALRINEATFGPEHPTVAIRLSNLAVALQDLGDAAGAKPLLERALPIDEATFGPEHPTVAIRLSNLALVLKDLGDAAGAKPLLERALRIEEATFGPEHPTVASSLSNLATVLRALGDAAGAKPLLERALRIGEATFGPEHPTVAITLSNLALVLKDLGEAAGAKPLLERALRIEEATFGPEHPNVAIRLSNLATVLHDLGDAAGARPLLERALAIVEARLPPDHPHQRIMRGNLAALDSVPSPAPTRP